MMEVLAAEIRTKKKDVVGQVITILRLLDRLYQLKLVFSKWTDLLSIVGKNMAHVLDDLINTETNNWDNQGRYILRKLREEAGRYFYEM